MITRGILWNCFYMWQDLPSLWCNIATNCDQFFLARTQESKTPCKIIRALPTLWFSQQTLQFVYPRGVPIVHVPARNVAWSEELSDGWKTGPFPLSSSCHHGDPTPPCSVDRFGRTLKPYCWTKFSEFLRIDRESYLTRYKIRKQTWWLQECIFKGGNVSQHAWKRRA